MKKVFSLSLLFLLARDAIAFAIPTNASQKPPAVLDRSAFLAVMTTGIAMGTVGAPSMAWAGDDSSKSGTKKDPAFEACLSTCMYECTKPKGAEQKSRKECLPECKQSCATTKAQLLTGEPKSI
jgi:hypothetical protein